LIIAHWNLKGPISRPSIVFAASIALEEELNVTVPLAERPSTSGAMLQDTTDPNMDDIEATLASVRCGGRFWRWIVTSSKPRGAGRL
jgi:hypothetical protein